MFVYGNYVNHSYKDIGLAMRICDQCYENNNTPHCVVETMFGFKVIKGIKENAVYSIDRLDNQNNQKGA